VCVITVPTRNASKTISRHSRPHALRAHATASKLTDSHIQSSPFPSHHAKHSEELSTDLMCPLHLTPRQQGRGRVNCRDRPSRTIQLSDLIPAQEGIGHRLSLIPQVGVLRMMSGQVYSLNLWRAYGKVGPARVSVAFVLLYYLSSFMQTIQF
jgi:hypothetical protein